MDSSPTSSGTSLTPSNAASPSPTSSPSPSASASVSDSAQRDSTEQRRQSKGELEGLKKDSGVDLNSGLQGQGQIPRFHFPFGNPAKAANRFQPPADLDAKIAAIFSVSPGSPGKTLHERDFTAVTAACTLPRFMNAAFFRKASIGSDGINYSQFKTYWSALLAEFHTMEAIIFGILKEADKKHLTPKDVEVAVQDVTLHHPGLEFLSTLPVFQNRYVETVIARLFYAKTKNFNKLMTFTEFVKSKFTQSIKALEHVEDINWTQDIFSYQHFYVIYCKFWELDRDHDMVIDLHALRRYDNGAMTETVLRRVVAGCGKLPSLGQTSTLMSYEDFVWFILSVEEKRTMWATEYWFRCLDLDGDGCISLYELRYFFEEQYERMLRSRMSDLWKFDDFVCSLIDLIKPVEANKITLNDLKKCGCAPLFFDMLFDLRKYDAYIRRIDPSFREQDDVYFERPSGERVKLEGFQKFAAKAYSILAEEESQSASYGNMDDMDDNALMDGYMGVVSTRDWEVEDDNTYEMDG
ncbi:hypothetical protein BC831DRAFT_456106 [Entophlyctis helioformis]|nr:hypothetical protein BC831DRAFT_456106 [Entophlyctis helioformis]